MDLSQQDRAGFSASEQELRATFERLMELWRAAARGDQISFNHVISLIEQARSLFRELMRPVSEQFGADTREDSYDGLSVEETRRKIAQDLRIGMPLPSKMAVRLANTLESLNAGHVWPLLERTAGKRGRAPHLIAETKLRICLLIRYRYGLGDKLAQVEAEVASAIGRTHEAIAKWPKELVEVFGKQRVCSLMEASQRLGLYRRSAESSKFSFRESATNNELFYCLETDLEVLSAEFRRVITIRGDCIQSESNQSGRIIPRTMLFP